MLLSGERAIVFALPLPQTAMASTAATFLAVMLSAINGMGVSDKLLLSHWMVASGVGLAVSVGSNVGVKVGGKVRMLVGDSVKVNVLVEIVDVVATGVNTASGIVFWQAPRMVANRSIKMIANNLF